MIWKLSKHFKQWTILLLFLFLVFILSVLFTIEPTNLKNLSKKHDQTSINLTVFDHGLTTSLTIFLILIYLFVRLNVSAYILMIYKYFKIRAQFAFWLNINEIQPSKYTVKIHNPIFLDPALCFKFLSSHRVWSNLLKIYHWYIIDFIFHTYWRFSDI